MGVSDVNVDDNHVYIMFPITFSKKAYIIIKEYILKIIFKSVLIVLISYI